MRIDTHDVAVHANTAAYTQEVISTGPESPDLPNWSAMQHADESGKLESHANESRRPADVSVTSGLPASGTEPRMGGPERPRDQRDARTRRAMWTTQIDLQTR